MGDVYEFEVTDEEPRVLSVDIIEDPEERKKVVQDLCAAYNEARGQREEKEYVWAKWRRQFEAKPMAKTKNHPYPNASNVVPPLSQIVGQALFGHLKEMYDAIDPPWYVKPLREGDEELRKQAEVLTKYYNILSKSRLDLNLSKFERDFLQEVAVMGTCFVKVPWITKPWHFKTGEGGEEEVSANLHDGPQLVVVPVEDIVYPENYTDVQTMPWIAHDFSIAKYEVEDLATRGIYDAEAVEALMAFDGADSRLSQRDEVQDELRMSSPSRVGQFVLTEVYFYFDSDGDGLHEDLVFTIHVPSGIVLRQGYNEFGYRMLSAGTFLHRTFAIEGRGSGQTTEHQQDEIEGIHNVRNDNMKFANMRVLAARRNVLRENETFYPGKVFQVDNPREDIVPIQLGEVYPSSLQAENMTMNYAREASGMSSIMSGFADQRLGTRDTFRGQSMRMSRGQGLFITIADGLNECFSEVGMMIFFQLVRNRDRVMANERLAMRLNPEELDVLESVISMQLKDVPLKLAFTIRTSDIEQTFEAKRQNLLSLTQLFSQYAMQTTPLAMQLFGPEGQQIQQVAPDAYQHMLSIYTGSTKLMSEVFKFFGEEGPEQYVPDTKKYELMLEMIRTMNGQMVEQARIAGGAGAMAEEPIRIEEEPMAEGRIGQEFVEDEEGGLM